MTAINEKEWTLVVRDLLGNSLKGNFEIHAFTKTPYALEVQEYGAGENQPTVREMSYETDLVVVETIGDDQWKPRVIIELKIHSITTHDAITYSQKAFTHKTVHPYLRYGILLGNRQHYPLPGRLFRHGAHFDFMASWVSFEPSPTELAGLREILEDEIQASILLEESIYASRSRNRERYTFLHRPLRLY